MSNKETKTRVANAFRAMKAIGITEDKVKPVLKSLLKLYDKNWILIEEENYRALADAIFERQESEAVEQSKKTNDAQTKDYPDEETRVNEEPERPLKRLRRGLRNGQPSSNTTIDDMPKTPLIIPKEEPTDLPEAIVPQPNASKATAESPQPKSNVGTSQSPAKNKGKQPVYPGPLITEGGDPGHPSTTSRSQQNTQLRTYSRSHSHATRLRDRGTGAASLQISPTEEGPVPENSARTGCQKEPKDKTSIHVSPEKENTENNSLIKPKDEPLTYDTPCSVPPSVVNHSDTPNRGDSSSRHSMPVEHCVAEPLALESISGKEPMDEIPTLNQPINNSEMALTAQECSSNVEIASSPSGEVKLMLSCKLDPGRSDFHMPSLEEVLNYVKDNHLISAKSADPNTTVMRIMEEICECFLKLGADCNSQSPKTIGMGLTLDPVSKTSGIDTLEGGDLCGSSLNGLVDTQSVAKLTDSQTSVPASSCNGTGVVPQPNNMNAADRETKKNCDHVTNAPGLNVVQKPTLPNEAIKSLHDVDIAKGRERIIISIVNEVSDELPPSFYYISQNAAFQNAYLNFSLAQIRDNNCCATCDGDCMSSSIPCACAHENGGEFAYTGDGLVKEELLEEFISLKRNPTRQCQFFCKQCPLERSKCEDIIEHCKGHVTKKFIKECWRKCGCNKQCGNRVVQRGIKCNLQVFMTPEGKGWGLRTVQDLPKGAFVCEYVGEVLTNAELFERVLKSPEAEKHSYPVLLDAHWSAKEVLKDEEALCLDATYYGNVARFINHRCFDASLVEIPVEVETPDHSYYHVAFFTTREVKAMEELTWDYGIDFDDHEHPVKAFHCQCGSKFCRNIKRYSRSRAGRQ
ncbi:probable inactive histone-lysine N-methyltransferase SUVR2 [Andrographis paniculata]|uniref:probable inactive histone-lysine N-methyltransferase SUVR2 n=1 Tax=Andrographis paniculata TaxID=175694 RepID=UPI0021E7960A|nr:probable inactive histone-lysine N-methyltransferase SUVR2 [Andrographis paniculata]XP_051141999.1 probable inactive histone-lysine N-methyltransferase SUVR2 [Andrographis paniculata]XP_051142000.1 probable inactive histone-lysine N-methyltransferase SUVR2 [Andrographis paniculata]XP_051142001.1 probable inactive histone-lysine N-methyltransferase SUVR2 [Andrographis paniculata]